MSVVYLDNSTVEGRVIHMSFGETVERHLRAERHSTHFAHPHILLNGTIRRFCVLIEVVRIGRSVRAMPK